MMKCDIIVVGAGIAGCAAAISLARLGYEVLLLERKLEEPDRIVGELLQPGGILALKELGLSSWLEGIGAMPVKGYHIYWKGEQVTFMYPRIPNSNSVRFEGRSFHHGRFIARLREVALSEPRLTVIEGTVTNIVFDEGETQVTGVKFSKNGGSQCVVSVMCNAAHTFSGH
jgi:squalene monooxygenase